MKRRHGILGMAILPVGLWACGGSTAGPLGESASSGSDSGAASSGSDASSSQTKTDAGPNVPGDAGSDAAPAFDPGSIGMMVSGGMGDAAAPPSGVSPQVVTGCAALCQKEATAACPNQGTVADCVIGCSVLLDNPSCAASTTALFSCETTSTVSCDNTGKATLDACPLQEVTSAACFLQNDTDSTLAPACASYCAGMAAAKCPQDNLDGCQQGCQLVGSFIPGCDAQWKSYVDCASTATFTCGADQKSMADACLLQGLGYEACALGAVLSIDAGSEAGL